MEHPAPVVARLRHYEALLRAWAPRLDLVSPGDMERLWERHIEDALRALPAILEAPPGPCVDVGSGAGLPGIPLAIASERPWRLLEPRRRRAAFLEEVVRELELEHCEVVSERAETAARDPRLGRAHAVATARALAPPPEAEALCRPLVAPGGAVLLFVGGKGEIPLNAEEVAPGLLKIVVDAH